MLTSLLLKGTLLAKQSLLTTLRHSFAHNTPQAVRIFKHYYSNRLSLSPEQHPSYLQQLLQHPFNPQDHRWLSLTSNLQHNLRHYPLSQQLYILKAMLDLRLHNSLLDTIIETTTKTTTI